MGEQAECFTVRVDRRIAADSCDRAAGEVGSNVTLSGTDCLKSPPVVLLNCSSTALTPNHLTEAMDGGITHPG